MRFFTFLLMLWIAAAPAYAQEGQPRARESYKAYEPPAAVRSVPNPTAAPVYDMLARKAVRLRPADFPFGTFRAYYAATDRYDPLAENTIRRMLVLSYRAQNEPDPEKRAKSLDEYGDLLAQHLANIEIVNQALVLARENRKFGDPEFLTWMRAGLMRSVLDSGDGQSLGRAYNVVTLGEETLLLRELYGKALRTESAGEGAIYYNMHEVEDPATHKPYWVFVDTSRPMEYLERKKRETGNRIVIHRQ